MVGPGPGVAVSITGGEHTTLGDVQVPSQALFFTCHGGRPREGEENKWGDDRLSKRSMILYTLDLGETWLAAMWPDGDKDVFDSIDGAFEQDGAGLALVYRDGAPYLVQNIKTFHGKRTHLLWDIGDVVAGKSTEVVLEQQGVFLLWDPGPDDLLNGAACAGDVTAHKNNVFISAAHGDEQTDLRITQLKPGFPWTPTESNTAQEISVEKGPAAYSSVAGWVEGDRDVVGVLFEAGSSSTEWGPERYTWIVFRSYAIGPLKSDHTTTQQIVTTTQQVETTTVETTTTQQVVNSTQQVESSTTVETTRMQQVEIATEATEIRQVEATTTTNRAGTSDGDQPETSEQGAQAFCCVFSTDFEDPCGTCDEVAKLSSHTVCGQSRAHCRACTGDEATWCPARVSMASEVGIVLKKYSEIHGRVYKGAPVLSVATRVILGAAAFFALVTFGRACFHAGWCRRGCDSREGLARTLPGAYQAVA